MGIYDRDYYRREGPSFLGSFTSRAPVCKWLIIINVAMFVAQIATSSSTRDTLGGGLRADGAFTDALLLDSVQVLEHGQVWRLLTYAFLHAITWYHILFNMLFLWWMGNELEEMYGSKEFLALYLVAAVVAGATFLLHGIIVNEPMRCLGASGAVMALTVLFALYFPQRTILVFFVIPMPIWVVVVLYVGYDLFMFLLSVAAGQSQSFVAVSAHLGGALFGWLYYKFQWRFTSMFSGWQTWKRRRVRPQLRIYREEEATPAGVRARVPPDHEIDEHLEAKLDAVLAKMSQVGKENLSESEREVLQRASEIYKRRRT